MTKLKKGELENIADESVNVNTEELENIADESVVEIEIIQANRFLRVGENHKVSGDVAKNLVKKGIAKIKI